MNETKACPYCSEQVLATAIKCKHCGSSIDGPSGAIKKQFKMSPAFVVLGGIVVAISNELGLPVRYVGVSEKAGDLLRFDAEAFVDSLFE